MGVRLITSTKIVMSLHVRKPKGGWRMEEEWLSVVKKPRVTKALVLEDEYVSI